MIGIGAKFRLRVYFVSAKRVLKSTYDSGMEVQTGGKRRNSGRKTEPEVTGQVAKHTVTFDETTLRLLRVLGAGQVSRGIRKAARYTYNAYQNDKFTP